MNFESLLEEYRKSGDYIASVREGRTAKQFLNLICEEVPNARKYHMENNFWTRTPAEASCPSIDDALMWKSGVMTIVQCPRCWKESVYAFASESPTIDPIVAAVARCRYCGACFYAADGVVKDVCDMPWSDEKRQESLGKRGLWITKIIGLTPLMSILTAYTLLKRPFKEPSPLM